MYKKCKICKNDIEVKNQFVTNVYCENCKKTDIYANIILNRKKHKKHKINNIKICKICKESFFSISKFAFCEKCRKSKQYKDKMELIRIKRKNTIDNKGLNYKVNVIEKRKKTNLKKYGLTCQFYDIDRIKKTNLKKYGNENPVKSDEIRKVISTKVKNAYKNGEPIEKRKKTNLKKYGVEHVIQSEVVKGILADGFLKKYGVTHPWSSEQIKDKLKRTWMMKYGVDNPYKSDLVKHNIKNSLIKTFGVDHPFKNDNIKQKAKNTWMMKYGVDNPFKSKQIQSKIVEKNLKKYGVKYYVLTKESMSKRFNNYTATKVHMRLKNKIIEKITNQNFETEAYITVNKKVYSIDELDRKRKLAIFIDGDYWHANPNKYKEDQILKGNRMVRNIWINDNAVTENLQRSGYTVLRFWESDINKNILECSRIVEKAIFNIDHKSEIL